MKGVNKFGARKSPCQHGHTHASAKEARRCNDLHMLQRAGEIVGLEVEPRFTFAIDGKPVKHLNGRAAIYTPDFAYANLAIRGRKLDPIIAEQLDPAITLRPDLVTIHGGGNDVLVSGYAADVLDGGPGRDRLDASRGRDRCLRGEALKGCERRR